MQASHEGLYNAYRIQSFRQENARITTLVLDGDLQGAQPGQFAMVWLPGVGEKPFSLAGNAPLKLTIADVGPVSHALVSQETGARVWLRGPLGNGFSLVGKHHVLVGGGYGAAPLSFLAELALARGDEVTACLGARGKEDLLLEESLASCGCQVLAATENGSWGEQGLVTQLLSTEIERARPDCVYACGPTGMLMAVHGVCQLERLAMQLSFEGLMRCGIGLCGSCELPEDICLRLGLGPGWLVCHDGPVYRQG